MSHSSQTPKIVVLLHGILLNAWHLRYLRKFLKKHNYRVITINYPSTKMPLQDLAAYIVKELKHRDVYDLPLHIVGYSMGGLLARIIMTHHRPPHVRHVVQIGTPNHGSELVDRFGEYWLFKKTYGPAGEQLSTDQSSIRYLLGKVNFSLGSIAGDVDWDPVTSFFFDGPHDGKVSVESTRVEGMKDHLVVHLPHLFLPWSKEVCHAIDHFLQKGRFSAS